MNPRKRALSPVAQPPAKRLHAEYDQPRFLTQPNFDLSLSDELVLHVFSYLEFHDLCIAQGVNRLWARLAIDNELWKSLFVSQYPHRRLRGSRGYSYKDTSSHDRESKPLPRRAANALVERAKDWKWMYRVSNNWRTDLFEGWCLFTGVPDRPLLPHIPRPAIVENEHQPILLVAGDTLITASATEIGIRPTIDDRPFLHALGSERGSEFACLALDQSSDTTHLRFVSFTSTGSFCISSFPVGNQCFFRDVFEYTPVRRRNNARPIRAVYHHPLLVSLSSTFELSIFLLPALPEDGQPLPADQIDPSNILQHTLSSFSSFPPSSLCLSRVTAPPPPTHARDAIYKLVLAHTAPVYPNHWSAAAAELTLTLSSSSHNKSNTNSSTPPPPPPRVTVSNTRSTTTFRSGWIHSLDADSDQDGLYPSFVPGANSPSISPPKSTVGPPQTSMTGVALGLKRDSWGRKLKNVLRTETDGKRVVLAGDDNTLQVYRLYRPPYPAPIRLSYEQTLYGHTARITALCVADGRCISASRDGSIRVWDLEAGWSVEVNGQTSSCDGEDEDVQGQSSQGEVMAIAFDERRIVGLRRDGVVQTWSFDH